LDFAPDRNQWTVFTNNRAFINESTDYGDTFSYLPKETFVSRSRVPNLKFCISKFLTMFFKHQTFIPNGIRNKYYNRLRSLLINQYNAITHRLASFRSNNDNKTKTFIKFSYRHTTVYLGFHQPCTTCSCSTATVSKSIHRRINEQWVKTGVLCPTHYNEWLSSYDKLQREGDPLIQPNHREQALSGLRVIKSKRLGWSYEKKFTIRHSDQQPMIAFSNIYSQQTHSDPCFDLNGELRPNLGAKQTRKAFKYAVRQNRFLNKNKYRFDIYDPNATYLNIRPCLHGRIKYQSEEFASDDWPDWNGPDDFY